MRKEWTIEEIGNLVAGVQLLRPPAELASALDRDEQEVLDKSEELGLSTSAWKRSKRRS
jgi:hypothetical protein